MNAETVPDSSPDEKGTPEALEREETEAIELNALDALYRHPLMLQRMMESGWKISTSKDENGEVKTVEIRNDRGELEFYENTEALRRIALEEKKLIEGAEN